MPIPPESDISSAFPYTLHHINLLESTISYIDTGSTHHSNTTALFLHGNPTSSYIWRNIIPHLSPQLRCVAPDLIGMGASGKPNIAYRFVDHVRYLDTFLSSVLPDGKIILVVQDWGSALGLHWAHRHQDRIIALILMEFIRPFPTWSDVGPSEEVQDLFKAFRHPEAGRKLLIDDNVFLNQVLPAGVVRKLSNEEQEYYNHPFLDLASREPIYRWPNELPIAGLPSDVYEIVTQYHSWLLSTNNEIPKLLFYATPGAFVTPEKAKWYGEKMKNVRLVDLGEGVHYLQEDHPGRIGEESAEFVGEILVAGA